MESFGKYSLIRKLGSGGMAEVFLARTAVAQGLAKTLVIKKIHPAFAKSHQFVTMFVNEAKIALGLNHPNVIQVFDFGAVGETYFLAMEYVDGLDLLRLLQDLSKERRRLPVGLAAYIVQQVAKGLDYAHRKSDEFGEALGIVHRDISPQNVLLSWDGAVKVVDFGIARARDVHEDEGVIKGKFAYMSPEQARAEPVDCRSDVFSLGIVLHELVSGRPMFPGKGKEVLELVKAGAIPPVRDHAPDLPDALERIVHKALAYHRSDRYQTARDLQNDLGRFQLDEARKSGELLDSGALAQFLAQVVPAERRRPGGRPPPSRDRGSQPATPVSVVPLSLGALGDDKPASPAADRARKYVYVIEGVLRGTAALERRVGADHAHRLTAQFHQVARDVAFKLDALIDRPAADAGPDDRDEIRVVVGLPVAGEDDASRAIRVALALVDALDGIGSDVEPELRLSVGIQRGVATVPRKAPRGKPSYELEEATCAFAQKLAQSARGAEVLVGGRVYRAARADWSFEALPAIDLPLEDTQSRVDEDTEPGVRRARVYRLRGPKERDQRLRDRARGAKATDRDLEMKALRDAYRDVVANRKKRHIVVVGDTGVGKRSLVTAFLDSLPPGEAHVLRTSTRVGTAMTPFGVIADLGRDLLGLAEGAEPREVARRIELALPLIFPAPGEVETRDARGAAQVIGLMLGVRPTEGTGEVEIDPAERRQRVLQVMLRVEQRLESDKTLIVVAEDVHWCDQESMDVFSELLKIGTARPILGIATTRPDQRVLRAARDAGAEIVQLDELGPDARRRAVTEKLVPGHDADELVDQIVARTGGNPFFISEMVDALVERGILVPDPPHGAHPGLLRWARRDAMIAVPSSIEDVLATRFDRLPPAEKETLLHAAVLGRRVAPAAVSALTGRAAGADLDELVRRGLMIPDDGQFRFKNDMIMTVAYGLVAPEDRSRLHRVAAERIATTAGYRAGQDDALIARHLELAGDATAAAHRYLDAASHAVDVGGNADAFRQLTRALKLLPVGDHDRRFQAHSRREEILRRLARRPQQLREIHAMKKEAEALGDAEKLARAHASLAQFYIEVGKAPAAARAAVPLLDYARAHGDKLAEAEGLRLRAAVARLIGQNDEALRLGEAALEAAAGDDAAHLRVRATILNGQGTTLWAMGRLEQAIEAYAEALVIYRALRLPRLEARALNNMGIVFAALGEYEEALAHYKSALKIDQALGDRAGIAYKLGNIGQAYADLGDRDRAESYLSKAMKIAVETGDGSTEADAAVSLGQVKLARGDYDAATQLFERGLELATAARERYQEIRALEYIAMAQLERGQALEGALELARSATELARKMPMMVGIIFGLATQARALSALGRHTEAVTASREAAHLCESQSRPEGAEDVLWWHAGVLAAAGMTRESEAVRARARAEVDAKAARLADPELRRLYLAAHARH